MKDPIPSRGGCFVLNEATKELTPDIPAEVVAEIKKPAQPPKATAIQNKDEPK
mgnify:CR=1 FL=1